MSRIAKLLAEAKPLTVLAVAWIWLALYAFPGQMSADSYEHLLEGRAGHYTDGHPPVLDLVFRAADLVIAGGLLIFVAQSLAFLAGLYLVLRRTLSSERRAAWIAAALFVFPPVMLPFAAVWKDSLMAGFLMLGLAGLLDPRRTAKLAGLAAIAFAGALRYNAFAATFPLVILLFALGPMPWLKRYAIAAGVWLAITAATFGANTVLIDQKMYIWHSSLGPHDIAGTLVHLDHDLPDAELAQLFAGSDHRVHRDLHAHLRKIYTPKTWVPLVSQYEPAAMWNLPFSGTTPAPAAQRDAIERIWKHVLATYPAAYVRHRLAVMTEVLSFTTRRPVGTVPHREFKYPQTTIEAGLSNRASAFQLAMTSAMIALNRYTPIFEPWMYLALALVLLPFTRRHREAFAVLASGLVIEASLLPLAPTPDYRYSHWMVVCTCLAVVLIVARRASSRRVREP
jgi:hypothetical protein